MGFSLQIDNLGEAGTFVASPFIVSSGPVPPRPHTHTHTMLSWDFPGGPVVKALRFHSSGRGAIPGRGTKIPHDECGQKMEKTETKKKKIIKKKKSVTAQHLEEHSASISLCLLAEPPVRFR